MVVNLLKLLDSNVKIAGVMVFCIVFTYVLVPKVTELSKNLYSFLANYSSQSESSNVTANQIEIDSQSIYIPPNFGGPDSQHGSGRR
ncbi:MAG TPA: hypothetical protein VK203_29910 [Nostocaceae cyanobacterium]|nr:hypothetical protein [Nostocaceae cyanobacterium]